MEAIENGMKLWSSRTCITFKKRTNEKAFLYFFIGGRYVTQNTLYYFTYFKTYGTVELFVATSEIMA